MKKQPCKLQALFFLSLFFQQTSFCQLVINEVYADVAVGQIGDANGDEIRNAREDEFIELFNNDDTNLDLSGYEVWVGAIQKHQFAAGTQLPPKSFMVLFGGGKPKGVFGNSLVTIASSGSLGLRNNGTSIVVQHADGSVVDSMSYLANNIDASLVRTPEFTGDFLPHIERPDAFGKPFSPGTLANSFPYNDGNKTLVHFTNTNGTAIERDTAIHLFLNLINPRPASVAVTVDLTGGSGASEDLEGFTSEIINFPINASSQRQLIIPITQDDMVEGSEQFVFTITSINDPDSNQISVHQSFELTLFDDDTDYGLVLSEFLADPPNNKTGDANQDGVRHASQDEFLEFYNATNMPLDLTGLQIYDADALRHKIPTGTIIQPKQLFVVFGGGTITADFGGAVVQKANTNRLSLANEGDRIIIRDSLNDIVLFYEYGKEASNDQSLVFCPTVGATTTPILHTELNDGQPFSPGLISACELKTAISAPIIGNFVTIYPNPTSENFFLELPTTVLLKEANLISVQGGIVHRFGQTAKFVLPTTMRRGLYFLQVVTNKGIFIKKIIVK